MRDGFNFVDEAIGISAGGQQGCYLAINNQLSTVNSQLSMLRKQEAGEI